MELLPEPILIHVISYIPYQSWFNTRLVCKKWNEIGREAFDPSIKSNAALKWASENGKLEAVQCLLKDSRVVSCSHADHLLRWSTVAAIRNGHASIVDLLLDFTTLPTKCTDLAASVIDKNHIDVLKILVEKARILVDPFLFSRACANPNPDVVKVILNAGVDPSINDNSGFRRACGCGRTETVRLLLNDARVDPSAVSNEALCLAASLGHTQIVEILLSDSRVDPTVNNNIAILTACKHGYASIVKLLLGHPLVDPSDRSNASLLYCLRRQNMEILQILMDDPRIDCSIALMEACKIGNVETVEALLMHPKIDPSANDNQALQCAIKHRRTEVVKLLLSESCSQDQSPQMK